MPLLTTFAGPSGAGYALRAGMQALWLGESINLVIPNGVAFTNTSSVDFSTTDRPYGGGKCALFSGSNYLSVTHANAPQWSVATPNPLTCLALFSLADVSAQVNLLGKGSDTNTREYSFGYLNGNGVYGVIGNGAGSSLTTTGDYGGAQFTGALSANEWYCGFLSYDPTVTAGGTTYLQGGKIASQANLNTTQAIPNVSGNSRGVGAGGFGVWRIGGVTTAKAGNCALVATWNRLLSATEKASIYASFRAGLSPF